MMIHASVFVLVDLAWLYRSERIGATKIIVFPPSLSVIVGQNQVRGFERQFRISDRVQG